VRFASVVRFAPSGRGCESFPHFKGFLAILRELFVASGGLLLWIKTILVDLRVIVKLACIDGLEAGSAVAESRF
jgi:hypothetical protein